MGDRPVILCTLPEGELRDRSGAWRKLLGSGLVKRTEIPDGIRLESEPGARDELDRLIGLERDCCAWIGYTAEAGGWALTAEGEGVPVLRGMFRP